MAAGFRRETRETRPHRATKTTWPVPSPSEHVSAHTSDLSRSDALTSIIFESLSAGVIGDAADFIVTNELEQDGPRRLHPSDRFARVLVWMWREQGVVPAAVLIIDLMARLRTHPRACEIQPAITLTELAAGLRLAVRGVISEQEIHELMAVVREARND